MALAQEGDSDTLKPYQKYPTLPAFNILLMDSTNLFNTYNIPYGRPSILICFSPDCKHCKGFFKRLLPGMDSLKNVDFYIVTAYSLVSEIKKFYDEYHLGDYPNIKVVGRDYEFFYHEFYRVKFVPDLALYNGKKKLVKFFEGEASVAEIYEYSSKLN
jgi:thiol-disulfide isomerase/thioredoxin